MKLIFVHDLFLHYENAKSQQKLKKNMLNTATTKRVAEQLQ